MNKHLKLFFILFVSSLCLFLTSCDKDKGNDYAKDIEGTYIGAIALDEAEIPNVEILIAYKSKNKVVLSMNQSIAVSPVSSLDINIEAESNVKFENDVYNIDGNASFTMNNIPLPVNVKGSIDKANKAKLDITITGFPVVEFNGEKQ